MFRPKFINQCEIDIPILNITKGLGKLFYDSEILKKIISFESHHTQSQKFI